MQKRKLQVFVSSTYEDLIDQRLAAMEAILAAGHIPAAMEQFSPGDETAWQTIKNWIDESDAFILILGGRYGSIEPDSGKSYVQLEYEYAIEKKKPFFALVVSEKHHAERVKELGLVVDERKHQQRYNEFKQTVTERLSRFWNDKKDIQGAVFQKLPEWDKRSDLIGWIRADNAPSAEVTNELARLSQENRDLRSQINSTRDDFNGLSFDHLIRLLRDEPVSLTDWMIESLLHEAYFQEDALNAYAEDDSYQNVRNAGDLFEFIGFPLASGVPVTIPNYTGQKDEPEDFEIQELVTLRAYGLIDVDTSMTRPVYRLTQQGLRFRNRLLSAGDLDYRRKNLWTKKDES